MVKDRISFNDEGLTSFQGDHAGSSSSNDPRPSIKVLKVIKIEVEDEGEENKVQKFIMTMLKAVTLSVVIQWLFGKCSKRNKGQSTPAVEQSEGEDSEDFEIVSEPEDAN